MSRKGVVMTLQTLRGSNSKDVRNRTSPVGNKSNWQQRTKSESSSCSDNNPSTKSPNRISPKTERLEKEKRPTKLGGMESQFSNLQEELKQTKDQLISSELSKKRIQQESEESKNQISLLSSKLREFESQEDSRIFELRKLSQERDRAWQSELEAMQKQHSLDSSALASAMNELLKLKGLVREREKERDEVKRELEVSRGNVDSLLVDGSKLMDSFGVVVRELEESRVRVKMLEEMVSKFESEERDGELEMREKIERFEKEKESGELELEELRVRVLGFEEMVSKFEKEKENGESELEELRVRVLGFEEMVSKFEKEKQNDEFELEELREKVKKLEEIVSKFENEKENGEIELEASRIRVKKLQEMVSKFEKKTENGELELEKLRVRVTTFEEMVSKFEKEKENGELELEESRIRVKKLEEIANKFEKEQNWEIEVEELRVEFENQLMKSHEEEILRIVLLQRAFEFIQSLKIEASEREEKLEERVNNAKTEVLKLKASLFDKDREIQKIMDLNKKTEVEADSNSNIKFLEEELEEKEFELQRILHENEILQDALTKIFMEKDKFCEQTIKEKTEARETEFKFKIAIEEANQNKEKLDAIQISKDEMEMELKKLRIQADQWKKAAETAMALLTVGNKERLIERVDSLDSNSNSNSNLSSVSGKFGSLNFPDELDDEIQTRKNLNVLRRISGMWKK